MKLTYVIKFVGDICISAAIVSDGEGKSDVIAGLGAGLRSRLADNYGCSPGLSDDVNNVGAGSGVSAAG